MLKDQQEIEEAIKYYNDYITYTKNNNISVEDFLEAYYFDIVCKDYDYTQIKNYILEKVEKEGSVEIE